jgi:hypothetical protein
VIPIRKKAIDHDRLFKELLEIFFVEFITVFFPDLHNVVDFSELRFLQQEVFTDVTSGDKHRVDLVAEVGLQGEEGLILIHIEKSSAVSAGFCQTNVYLFFKVIPKISTSDPSDRCF